MRRGDRGVLEAVFLQTRTASGDLHCRPFPTPAAQSRPHPRGGSAASSSLRSISVTARSASAVALACKGSGKASSQARRRRRASAGPCRAGRPASGIGPWGCRPHEPPDSAPAAPRRLEPCPPRVFAPPFPALHFRDVTECSRDEVRRQAPPPASRRDRPRPSHSTQNCRDGGVSFSEHRRGCSHNHGVARWE